MPTHCKGYWNNSLIKIICLPISRKKQGCSLSVAEQGSDSPARIAPLERCHSQGCAHSTALPRPGVRWGLAEPPQHPALPLAAGVWPAVTKTGPTVSWKSSLWHAVPGGHGGCGDRGAARSWRFPQLQLAVCQWQESLAHTRDTPNWACFAAVMGHWLQQTHGHYLSAVLPAKLHTKFQPKEIYHY